MSRLQCRGRAYETVIRGAGLTVLEDGGSFLDVALNEQVVSAPLFASTIEGGVIQLEGTDPTEFGAFAPCFGR